MRPFASPRVRYRRRRVRGLFQRVVLDFRLEQRSLGRDWRSPGWAGLPWQTSTGYGDEGEDR